MRTIKINNHISIDEKELKISFIKSSGPGGQNINKVSTAVQIKLDVINSTNLTDEVKNSIIRKAGKKITKDGVLIIEARRFRTQEKNKNDAIERLVSLIKKSTILRKKRKLTKPSKSSIESRLEKKKKRASTKFLRKKIVNE